MQYEEKENYYYIKICGLKLNSTSLDPPIYDDICGDIAFTTANKASHELNTN